MTRRRYWVPDATDLGTIVLREYGAAAALLWVLLRRRVQDERDSTRRRLEPGYAFAGAKSLAADMADLFESAEVGRKFVQRTLRRFAEDDRLGFSLVKPTVSPFSTRVCPPFVSPTRSGANVVYFNDLKEFYTRRKLACPPDVSNVAVLIPQGNKAEPKTTHRPSAASGRRPEGIGRNAR